MAISPECEPLVRLMLRCNSMLSIKRQRRHKTAAAVDDRPCCCRVIADCGSSQTLTTRKYHSYASKSYCGVKDHEGGALTSCYSDWYRFQPLGTRHHPAESRFQISNRQAISNRQDLCPSTCNVIDACRLSPFTVHLSACIFIPSRSDHPSAVAPISR